MCSLVSSRTFVSLKVVPIFKILCKYNGPSMGFHIFMMGVCSLDPSTLGTFTSLAPPNFDPKLLGYHGIYNFKGKYKPLGLLVSSCDPYVSCLHLP